MKKEKRIKSHQIYIKSHKAGIKKIMEEKDFTSKEVKQILRYSSKNILLRLFLNVVTMENKFKNDFKNEIALILIVSRTINLNISKIDQKIKSKFKNQINRIKKDFHIKIDIDIETKILKELNNPKIQMFHSEFINHHEWYKYIGNIFALISDNKKEFLYKYGYLMSMFLLISFEYKINDPGEMFDVFLLKLKTNSHLNKATMNVSPTKFNSLIVKTNLWLANLKIDKFVKKEDF